VALTRLLWQVVPTGCSDKHLILWQAQCQHCIADTSNLLYFRSGNTPGLEPRGHPTDDIFVEFSAVSVQHLATTMALQIVTKFSYYTLSAWLIVDKSNSKHFIIEILSLVQLSYTSAAGITHCWGSAGDKSCPQSPTKPFRPALVVVWGPNHRYPV